MDRKILFKNRSFDNFSGNFPDILRYILQISFTLLTDIQSIKQFYIHIDCLLNLTLHNILVSSV